ncbi:MAG TPA: FeoA family protein [Thermoanaerobaculia bacterium]|nr:FeoA family protein [Thermoanaerobaculia bacterium]
MPDRERRSAAEAFAARAVAPDAPVKLSEVAAGGAARLQRRDLSEGEACLLAAMGLTEGCRLVVRVLGDPCIVEVRTTRIGLAKSVADRLFVLAEPGAAR